MSYFWTDRMHQPEYSAPSLTAVATDPGIFTVGSDGQGDGAILAANWATVNSNNPAA